MRKVLFFILAVFACMGVFAQQPVVAVAPFEAISGISATDANMLTRVFNIRLGNTNAVALVDRSNIDRILREHHFQAGDWSDMNKTAELGRALNADWIVRGELEQFGRNILLTVQFFDIRTFRYMGGGDIRIANIDDAYDNMTPLVNSLVETILNSRSQAATGRVYNIGDRGPAGGIIFFDKGVFSNGWRYLEAAPYDIGPAPWGAYGTYLGLNHGVNDDGFNAGGGKRNTQIIVQMLEQLGERDRAAQLCRALSINGYNDWYLPNGSELAIMNDNLGMSFRVERRRYWSSSEWDANTAEITYFEGTISYSLFSEKFYSYYIRAVRSF